MSTVAYHGETGEFCISVKSKVYGYFRVLIDEQEAGRVGEYNWSVAKRAGNGQIYFSTRIPQKSGNVKFVYLHRFIMRVGEDVFVDHVNPSDTLDNRKSNLRVCTQQENAMNSRPRVGASSSFKGVCWNKQAGKWEARIRINNKLNHLGKFSSETRAARAYDKAAFEHFGEFAKLNLPVSK